MGLNGLLDEIKRRALLLATGFHRGQDALHEAAAPPWVGNRASYT
jgi:hypothetical protein